MLLKVLGLYLVQYLSVTAPAACVRLVVPPQVLSVCSVQYKCVTDSQKRKSMLPGRGLEYIDKDGTKHKCVACTCVPVACTCVPVAPPFFPSPCAFSSGTPSNQLASTHTAAAHELLLQTITQRPKSQNAYSRTNTHAHTHMCSLASPHAQGAGVLELRCGRRRGDAP